MSIHRMLAVTAAAGLFFAAATVGAQDKSTSSSAAKPKAGVASTSKPGKAAAQEPMRLNGVNTKAEAERTGAKQAVPAAHGAPAEGRDYKPCHGKESDA